jgi:hypothetical protein
MAFARTSIIAIIASLTIAAAGQTAKADTYEHIDRLALRMQKQSRSLINEFSAHYRHKSHYGHMRSDAISLYKLSRHIHELAHHHGSHYYLAADLRKADRLFHHLEQVVSRVEHSYGGHTHGNASHVWQLMRQMKQTIHHLKSDIDSLNHFAPGHGHDHGYDNHGHGVSYKSKGIGIKVNGKGWSIGFGG